MGESSKQLNIYLEIGNKKVFAGALDWPGWCRSGRDETAALQALLSYSSRYERVLKGTNLGFTTPLSTSDFKVIEHLKGGAGTDFGAPEIAPSSDSLPLDVTDLRRFEVLLKACWQAFDWSVKAANEKELRKGPRGGGRDLDKIMLHILNAEAAYLRSMAWKHKVDEGGNLSEELERSRKATLNALVSAQRGQLPEKGPRGGVMWKPRYFIRRVTWHILDHAWEIEDRIL
jgi:hypothetical protein